MPGLGEAEGGRGRPGATLALLTPAGETNWTGVVVAGRAQSLRAFGAWLLSHGPSNGTWVSSPLTFAAPPRTGP